MKSLSQIKRLIHPSDNVSETAFKKASIAFSRRVIALTGIVLLGGIVIASAIAIPIQPAEASLSSLLNPYNKQANKQANKQTNKQARGRVPGRRRGGAKRGACRETENSLLALISATEVETDTLPETYVGGVTTSERPTVWFDVPYSLTEELTAEFVLQDNQGQDVYRVTSAEFSVPSQTPGMVGVSITSEVPLEIGRTYQWYFKVNCSSDSPIYVQGGIERVALDPDMADQLATASPLEKATIYRENEIWYDAVNAIAPLYLAQPSDSSIQSAWTDLLRSLDL